MVTAASLHGSYDPLLVTVSVAIAVFASFTALDLAGRMNAAGKRGRLFWLIAAATALGGGIWSMHFVAMLAFDLGSMAITYNAGLTIASLGAAILVVGAGLHIVDRWSRRWTALAAAGILTGLGVAVMHYIGMAAMRMHAETHYDPLLVGVSVAIAITAATVALFLATYLTTTWHRIASAFVMGAAIASMHYTGMAAVRFTEAEGDMAMPASIPPQLLAILIAAATIIVLALGLVATLVDRRLAYRAQQEEAARQNDAMKFRALVTNIPGVCYRCLNDANYTIEFISNAIEELTGYPASDFIGNHARSAISVYHPDDVPGVIKATNEGILQRRPFNVEFRMLHKDGSVRWVSERGQPIFDEAGSVTHLDCVIFDMTERRRIEEELRAGEQKFKTMLTNIPGACYRCANDAAYTMEFISDAIEDVSGYPASDFIGNRVRTYASLFHPDDGAHVDKVVGDAVARREPFTIEYRIMHKNGSFRWVHEKGQGVFDGDGKLLHLDGAIFDITARRRIESDLRESEAKFKTLLSNIPGACYRGAHDAEFTMEFISDAIVDIVGYPAGDFIGNRVRSFVSVIHPDDSDRVESTASAAIKARRPYTIDYRLLHRDGTERWIHEKGQAVYGADGTVRHLDGAIFDITDRHQMEEELRATLAELRSATDRLAHQERFATIGQVAATVSHELRNPLGAIRNSMGVVRQIVGKERPAVERALERADRNVDRCAKIIYDLLAFTQKRELQRGTLAIDGFVGETLDAFRLPEGVELVRELRCGTPAAADGEALRQAIVKLLENAVQALQEPGWTAPAGWQPRITVRMEGAGPHLRLSIADNGPGIATHVLPKVFEPLFTTKSFGIGLGLPTVRQIVEQHGGTIDVESAVGEGTTFTIWLPRLQDAADNSGETAAKAAVA